MIRVHGADQHTALTQGLVHGGSVHPAWRVDLDQHEEMRSASEPYALLCAQTVREKLATTWGLSETGAAGPTGNRYGDDAGHTCVAVSGPAEMVATLETGDASRADNMDRFAVRALELLKQALSSSS